MSIPNICTNPDCTSRLHFIGGGYVYKEWLDSLTEEEEE